MRPALIMRASCLLLVILMAGCASVPQASRERDEEAKLFLTHPNAATLYVFRNDIRSVLRNDSVLFLDGRIIGGTLAGGFFRIDTLPGVRVLHGHGFDQGMLKVNARSGEITFVSLNVAGGTSRFEVVSPEVGKAEIARCCVLIENWTPGQRPLLR
jgi:hypothetical protein